QNQIEGFLPKRLAAFLIQEIAIDGTVQSNQVRKEQRLRLAKLLLGFSVIIEDSLPIEQAVVTAGGLKLSEVDPKTLRSKQIKNLTICGELLNVLGPVGGYNLTIALSTGFVAGSNIGL
ncbi:MAG TPA: aminoacetone oxidase family FAD-binding enzyme, partial [Erysipelothrix sp.]|nr:aminoacetone oxidase family FAD-binding enzyme [Erysipelothrix sp.]